MRVQHFILSIKFLLLLICMPIQSALGQTNSFIKAISKPYDQSVNSAIELPESEYVLIVGEEISNESFTKLLKINQNGDIIGEQIIDEASDIAWMTSIIKGSDNTYLALGSLSTLSYTDNKIWLIQFDEELSIINEKKIPVPFLIFSVSGIFDHLNNIIINGWYYDTGSNNYSDIFILRCSSNADSLTFHHYIYPSVQRTNSIMEKLDYTGYYMPIYGRMISQNNYLSNMVELDYNFNITFEDSITNDVGINNNIRKFNENKYLLSGQTWIPYSPTCDNEFIAVQKLDKDYHAYNYQRVGPYLVDTVTYPAWVQNMDFVDTNNVFVGGTVNIAMYPNPNQNSYLILANLDSELNKQWQYFYGLDKYYEMHSILATQDGGCLMLATYFNFTENEYERDILLIKVDSNGLITGTNSEPDFKISNAIIYPNPGTDYLNIQSGPQIKGAEFYLFDIQGKPVLNEKFNNTQLKVNTANLVSGTYPWQIVFKNNVIESGNWIKK